MSTLLDWDDLRYFLAVARTRRLLRAGKALGVRHTTVARRIDGLEESLGVKLFKRTAAGWTTTPAGDRVLARAEAVEQGVVGLVGQAREAAEGARGPVKLAIVDSWASHWLAPRLPELYGRHPDLRIELVTGMQPTNLTRGDADVAIRTPRPAQPDLAVTPLGAGAFGLFGTRELAAAHAGAVAEGPPEGVPLGVYSSGFAFLQSAGWFRPFLERGDVRVVSSNTHALAAVAASGHALAVLPAFVAVREGLFAASPRDVSRNRVWIVVHKEMRRDPRVKALVGFLKELAPDLSAWPAGPGERAGGPVG